MSMIMESIASSLPAMSNVLFLMLGTLVILAIAGVAFFMGKFQHCNDVSNSFVGGSSKVNCYGVTSVEGYWTPTLWSNRRGNTAGEFSFDNVAAAILSLEEVLCLAHNLP